MTLSRKRYNYDKRDDFDFEIVNFPFVDGEYPSASLDLFAWLEHLRMLVTAIVATNSYLTNSYLVEDSLDPPWFN